jgi:sulfonate transport system permease protein
MVSKKMLKGVLLPAAFLLFWIIGSWRSVWNTYVIPAPADVAGAFWQLTVKGILVKHIAASFFRVFAGFIMALMLAFPLGVVLGTNRRLREYLYPLLEFLRHVPPLAALPMLILWFGIGEWPKLLIVVLATFFPIFLNTLAGVANCDSKLLEVGKSFGLTQRAIFQRIMLPAALPSVLVGMRLGLGYSWRALVGAELIAAASGIGYMILDAEQLSRPDLVVVGILVIGVLGSLIDGLFFWLTQRIIPWKEGGTGYGRG